MTGPAQELKRPIRLIARDIIRIWSAKGSGVNYAAVPYLDAMLSLEDAGPAEMYGYDSAASILTYGLSNMRSFRGPEAKALKAELKAHLA